MSEPEDPQRLTEAGASALSRLFKAGQGDVASEADLAALAHQLSPVLSTPTPLSRSWKLAKVAAGIAAAVAVGGSVLLTFRAHPALPPARRVEPGPPSAVATPLAPRSAPTPVVPTAAAPAVPAAPPAPMARPAAESEASLLERARRALSADPARALALAGEHARRFPSGALSQEREVIAIAALRRLGRSAEADARAARFDRSYPHSAHQHAVDGEH